MCKDDKEDEWKQMMTVTYHIDKLNESQSERNLDLLCHVLYRPDEFVVTPEEIPDEALFLLRTQTWKRRVSIVHHLLSKLNNGSVGEEIREGRSGIRISCWPQGPEKLFGPQIRKSL